MKKWFQHPLLRVLSLVLALLLLSACGASDAGTSTSGGASSDTDTEAASTSESETAEAGEETGEEASNGAEAEGEVLAAEQVLNLAYTELERLDVNDVRNSNETQVLTQVQEGLFRIFTNEDGLDVLEYAGATGYDVSEDGLTYTFYLREESVWSDGVPVTSQNYIDSWLRLLDPEGTFPDASEATGIAGAEAYYNGEGSAEDVAIEYIDDYTFRVTLAAPDASFLNKVGGVTFYPIRKDLIDAAEAAGEDWTNDYTLHVFNGPFVISNRVLENSMTLTKNETYWDADNVILTQVNLQVVDETATVAQLIESQQLDVTTLSDLEYVEQWQPLVDDGTLVHTTLHVPTVYFLVLNQHEEGNGGTSGLMLNDKVRLALSLSLDREEYVELFQEGYATPAYGLIPYGMTVGDTEFRSYHGEPLLEPEYAAIAADNDALRALFEEGAREAGYTGEIADVVLTTMVYDPSTQDSNILEWFKQQFESKLGINVDIVICPDLSAEQTARAEYQYDYYKVGWTTSYNEPVSFLDMWVTGGGYAQLLGGFSDEEYDSLVAQIASSLDEAERLELSAQAEDILITKGGIIPIYYSQRETYVQSYVQNLSLTTFGPSYEFSRAYILEH